MSPVFRTNAQRSGSPGLGRSQGSVPPIRVPSPRAAVGVASAVVLAALIFSSPVSAQPAQIMQGGVQVTQVWSRAALAGRNGAVYLTVTLQGVPDRLLGAASPVAERVELHESLMEQGVMKMRAVQALPVGSDKPLTLAPGGYHIMLIGLKQKLTEGDMVPITLTFEKAGEIRATATVAKAGAPTPHRH